MGSSGGQTCEHALQSGTAAPCVGRSASNLCAVQQRPPTASSRRPVFWPLRRPSGSASWCLCTQLLPSQVNSCPSSSQLMPGRVHALHCVFTKHTAHEKQKAAAPQELVQSHCAACRWPRQPSRELGLLHHQEAQLCASDHVLGGPIRRCNHRWASCCVGMLSSCCGRTLNQPMLQGASWSSTHVRLQF